MRWPWQREAGVEVRESATDQIVAQILANAGGVTVADAEAIGVAVAAAGVWSRAFTQATVSPAVDVLTPAYLGRLGWELLTRGESVSVIDVRGGRIELTPATIESVSGDVSPETWRYIVVQDRPTAAGSRPIRRRLPAAQVIHARINASPAWSGRSPLTLAGLTAQLAAHIERSLGREAAGSHGYVLPIPKGGQETTVTKLRADIKALRGKLALVETTAGGWGEGAGRTPRRDWEQRRIGLDPPAAIVELRGEAARSLLEATGTPPALVMAAPAGAQREALRRFETGVLEPVGAIVAAELGEKLDRPNLALTWERLNARDLVSKARAFKALTDGGLTAEAAAAAVGIEG